MISQSHALPLSSSLPSLLPLPAFLLVPPSLFLSFPPSLFLSCLFKQFRHFRSSNILKTLVNFRAAGGVAASALISAKSSLSLSLSFPLSQPLPFSPLCIYNLQAIYNCYTLLLLINLPQFCCSTIFFALGKSFLAIYFTLRCSTSLSQSLLPLLSQSASTSASPAYWAGKQQSKF